MRTDDKQAPELTAEGTKGNTLDSANVITTIIGIPIGDIAGEIRKAQKP